LTSSPLSPEQVAFVFHDCHPELEKFVRWKLEVGACGDDVTSDILQETYRSAWGRIREFRWHSHEAAFAYLKRIAERKIIDWHRHKARLPERSLSLGTSSDAGKNLELEPHTSGTPSGAIAREEAAIALKAALATIPPEWQQAIDLRFFEDLPMERVAEQMGVSEGAVRGYLQRAKEKLRAVLGRSSLYLSSS
jgi:RNA polymerase sigma-70 factor (ECF subfamily)